MPVDAIELSRATPEIALGAVVLLGALTMFRRQPKPMHLLGVLAVGLALVTVFRERTRLDARGVTQSYMFWTRSLAWADVSAAAFEMQRTKQGEVQDLIFAGRGGEIVLKCASQFGPQDAATLEDFLACRLPEPYGRIIHKRLAAMQSTDTDRQYWFSASPGS